MASQPVPLGVGASGILTAACGAVTKKLPLDPITPLVQKTCRRDLCKICGRRRRNCNKSSVFMGARIEDPTPDILSTASAEENEQAVGHIRRTLRMRNGVVNLSEALNAVLPS